VVVVVDVGVIDFDRLFRGLAEVEEVVEEVVDLAGLVDEEEEDGGGVNKLLLLVLLVDFLLLVDDELVVWCRGVLVRYRSIICFL
jgi:hypothetical protein